MASARESTFAWGNPWVRRSVVWLVVLTVACLLVGFLWLPSVHADFRKTEVKKDGQPVELSAMELMLLRYFVGHRGQTLSREELLKAVWGYDHPPTTRTVDVHVASLRRKLERSPRHPEYVLTIHRLGYKFVG